MLEWTPKHIVKEERKIRERGGEREKEGGRRRESKNRAIHMLIILEKYKINEVVVFLYYAAKVLMHSIKKHGLRSLRAAT